MASGRVGGGGMTVRPLLPASLSRARTTWRNSVVGPLRSAKATRGRSAEQSRWDGILKGAVSRSPPIGAKYTACSAPILSPVEVTSRP
jgi:hypothetical protein